MTDSDDRAGSQPSDWEQRLIEHGTPIEEQDFGDAVEAEVFVGRGTWVAGSNPDF